MMFATTSDFEISQQSHGNLGRNAKAYGVENSFGPNPVINTGTTKRNFSITCKFAAHQLGTIVDEAKIRIAFQQFGDVTDVKLAKVGFNSVRK